MSDAWKTPPPPRLLVPYKEAQHVIGGISGPTLHKMIDEGQLDRVRIGKRCFITAASIDRYIESQLAAGA